VRVRVDCDGDAGYHPGSVSFFLHHADEVEGQGSRLVEETDRPIESGLSLFLVGVGDIFIIEQVVQSRVRGCGWTLKTFSGGGS